MSNQKQSSCPRLSLNTRSTMIKSSLIFLLLAQTLIINQSEASGIFEINLAALNDAYGRDLRLDCCAWQNLTQPASQQQAQQSSVFHQNNLHSSSSAAANSNNQQQSCDPTKCQLIIRICVKNYQTQIDPSQCTFGELSAQVMKPNEQIMHSSALPQYNQIISPLTSGSSSFARLQQQQQLAAFNKLRSATTASNQHQQVANIHHQRMLLQQLQAPQLSLGQTHEQHSRVFHQSPNVGPMLASGQPRAMRQIAFDQPISFPFNFTWPGAFSLVLDAWYESPTGIQQVAGGAPIFQAHLPMAAARHHHHHHAPAATTYDLYKKQLIIQHSMHGWLTVKNEWTSGVHKTDSATLVYSYRVTCQPNYYGEQCNILCRPRDDVYGHFTCSQQGEVVCLPGWQGQYCEEPICLPGCHKDQGNCTRPNECICRFGWQGPSCEQCVRHPKCVHGTCSRPHECICEEGWGGLLCNEDLNYCNNHQPCKNSALCTNTFDARGISSYVCTCEEGFAGKNCERRVSINSSSIASKQDQNVDLIVLTQAQSNLTNTNSNQQQQKMNQKPSSSSSATAAATTRQHNSMPPLSSYHFSQQPQATTQASQNGGLDHRVMVAYGIIIVCMVILVVLLLLRIFFERLSGAVVGQTVAADSHRSHRHSHRSHHSGRSRSRSNGRSRHRSSTTGYYTAQDLASAHHGSSTGDVATMQNHQNIYKSRTSLSTDKVPFGNTNSNDDSALETCSSSSMSSVSSSTDYNDHYHRSLAAAYGASMPAMPPVGHYSASASLHYAAPPARYYPANYAHYGAQYGPAPPPIAAAHSVHNISSTYQQLMRAAASTNNVGQANLGSRQPPPPPYHSTATNQQQASQSNSIYNASTLYGALPAMVHPAGLHHAPSSTIYTNASNYGTAATLANQAVSSITTSSAPSNANNNSNNQTPTKKAKQSSNNQSDNNNNNNSQNNSTPTTANNNSSTVITERANDNSDQTNDAASPYGNLQQASAASQQQQQCYVILCNHHNQHFQS